MEALEGRTVLSTFKASNIGELVADIAHAAQTPGANTILLSSGNYVAPQSIQIRGVQNLTIAPAKAGATVNLIGGVTDRVLTIDGGDVTLKGLNISNGGGALGAGIGARNANLTLDNVRVFDNVATSAAGGVYVQGGSLNLRNSSILNNRVGHATGSTGGGLVAVDAATQISSSVINQNSVFAVDLTSGKATTGVGAGIYTSGGTLNVAKSTISQNVISSSSIGPTTTALGGGVYTANTAATVSGSTISNNGLSTFSTSTANAQGSAFATSGGSLAVTSSTITKNGPGGWRSFWNRNATVTLTNSTLDGQRISGTRNVT
ncbi:hypothetical protein [Aquisphaera giovannonii]|nr:hypothetical protein [Aquisphaera giovannonii]